MTDCLLTLSPDHDSDQVTLEDLPEGPAGGAALAVCGGVELLFDCADGRLSRVFIDTGQPDGTVGVSKRALDVVATLLGAEVATAVKQARQHGRIAVELRAPGSRLADLSRLARLDAARLTSPVAASPWWDVEAAQLAGRAGLAERAAADARRAADALADPADEPLGARAATAVLAVADIVQATESKLADRLRERADALRAAAPAAEGHTWPIPAPAVSSHDGREGRNLQWWLDPRLIPAGVFRHELWPGDELRVRADSFGITVEAQLAPGADRGALRGCQARLIDPARRTVLGAAPLRYAGDSRIKADVPARVPDGEAWAEIVDEASRPVLSGQLHRIRRAMRWAGAALAADRWSFDTRDPRWLGLATAAWERCAEDWSSAGDVDRAYLATAQRAAGSPGIASSPSSAWAKELAGRPALRETRFLAEVVG